MRLIPTNEASTSTMKLRALNIIGITPEMQISHAFPSTRSFKQEATRILK